MPTHLVSHAMKARVKSSLVLVVIVMLGAAWQISWTVLVVIAGAVGIGELMTHSHRPSGRQIVVLYLWVFGTVVSLGLIYGVELRYRDDWWLWVLVVVAGTVATDVAGLLLGRRYGTPGTFFSRVSSAKSYAGFVAAYVAGVLAVALLVIIGYLCGVMFESGTGAFLALSIPTIAIAGDLAASKLKRLLGIKDFGSWIPGHGGINDRLDSVAPVALWVGSVVMHGDGITLPHLVIWLVIMTVLVMTPAHQVSL